MPEGNICKPNATGIDAKIAECERLLKENTNTQSNNNSDNQPTSNGTYGSRGTELPSATQGEDKIPDVEIIKKCMIGEKIQDRPDGYFAYHNDGVGWPWIWTIETNEIKSVEIMKSEKKGTAFFYDVRLLLQAKTCPTQYVFDLQIVLVLDERNKWTVDNIVTKDIYLVKTDRYDHCITMETAQMNNMVPYVGQSTDTKKRYDTFTFTNNCNIALVVCGQELIDDKWIKFHTYIYGNNKSGAPYRGNFTDYKIDFIERYNGDFINCK